MAEGSETPDGGPAAGAQSGGLGAEGRGRGPEGDLLAERRARRAAESGDAALIRRAEAAEATVRTLETHVATLQRRLREAEEAERRIAGLIEAERAPAGADRLSPAEQELRRAKQREYAEQQLRVEAEDRCIDVERESRLETERLSRRLSASERAARELAAQLESVQRELAEAEQAAAADLSAMRRAETAFQARLTELEGRALEIHRGVEVERSARARSERQLERMRRGNRRVVGLVGELRSLVGRLMAVAPTPLPSEPVPDRLGREAPLLARDDSPGAAGGRPASAQREEMADALAAAVERLRARVEEVDGGSTHAEETSYAPSPSPPEFAAPSAKPAPHKHSMSGITRMRIRRKDRRARRSDAARAPSMRSQ